MDHLILENNQTLIINILGKNMSQQQTPKKRGQSVWTVIKSVASSFIGVQNSQQHAEDFEEGKASTYIIAGIIGALLFVLVVFTVVNIVLSNVSA